MTFGQAAPIVATCFYSLFSHYCITGHDDVIPYELLQRTEGHEAMSLKRFVQPHWHMIKAYLAKWLLIEACAPCLMRDSCANRGRSQSCGGVCVCMFLLTPLALVFLHLPCKITGLAALLEALPLCANRETSH